MDTRLLPENHQATQMDGHEWLNKMDDSCMVSLLKDTFHPIVQTNNSSEYNSLGFKISSGYHPCQ